jgi:hypothetical protein
MVAPLGSLVVALGVLIVCVIVGVAASSLKGLSRGRVTLQCPHCGQETPAQGGICRNCGKDL